MTGLPASYRIVTHCPTCADCHAMITLLPGNWAKGGTRTFICLRGASSLPPVDGTVRDVIAWRGRVVADNGTCDLWRPKD